MPGEGTVGGPMDAVMPGNVPDKAHPIRQMEARDYLEELNQTAFYAATRGLPFLLPGHAAFLVEFVDAWLRKDPHGAQDAAEALFKRTPRIQPLISSLLSSQRPRRALRLTLLLIPFLAPLVFFVPYEAGRAVLNSAWDVLRKGIRGVPPLITAVVVVFVTSDAWRILGTGFTARFSILVALFMLASWLYLIRRTCWRDIDAKPKDADELLAGIRPGQPMAFRKLLTRDIKATPMVRPRGFGGVYVTLGYWALTAFALIIAALFVSLTLILIGVILINKGETQTLANAVYVYHTHTGGVVITRQLLSLSFSLGAFAAFFLVAAQRPRDRKEFMANVLLRYRRVLLVYSVYCRAHDRAEDWTGIPVRIEPLDGAAAEMEPGTPPPAVPMPVPALAAEAGARPQGD